MFLPSRGRHCVVTAVLLLSDRAAEGLPRPNLLSLFDRDITEAIQQRIDMGDSIVLGIDHNSDVRTGPLALLLRHMGLRDSILDLHGSCSAPATQNRNTTCTPIDAIWVLPVVQVLCSGYCPFDNPRAPFSDHRLLWVELDNTSLLGKDLPPRGPVRACWLRAYDPRLRKRYV